MILILSTSNVVKVPTEVILGCAAVVIVAFKSLSQVKAPVNLPVPLTSNL